MENRIIFNFKTMTEKEFMQRCNNYDGLCLACFHFTEGGTEPDAENYPCENCEENFVYGIEQCLIMGKIVIKEPKL